MTMVTVDAHRDTMMAHLQAHRPKDFLNLATPWLCRFPEDDQVRLLAARELINFGLVELAVGLLKDYDTLSPEIPAIRRSLENLKPSRVLWATYQNRFEENLQTLGTRGVDVDAIRCAWHQHAETLSCFRDRTGQLQVLWQPDASAQQWIPYFGDHDAVDRKRPLPIEKGELTPGPYLFDGLGLGGFFERLYKATMDTFLGYSCALYVIEPDPLWIALVLHLRDWRSMLADTRIFWLIGSDWEEGLETLWHSNVDLPFPAQAFALNGFRSHQTKDPVEIVRRAMEARTREVQEAQVQSEAKYESRDMRYWATRFENALNGRGEPLRILAAVSTHTTFLQYSVRDVKRALEALGHECMVLSEKTPYEKTSPLTYYDAIRDFDPDLFFNIDHLRPEFTGVIPANLPILSWDQDHLPHVFTEANIKGIGRLDFVTGYSKSHCLHAGCDPRQLLYARVPTSPEQFDGPPLNDQELAKYSCDVSYVSHASQTPQAFHFEERNKQGDETVKKVMDTLFEMAPDTLRQHTVIGYAAAEVMVREAFQRVALHTFHHDLQRYLIEWYLWRLGDRMFRHEALGWVADWAQRHGRTFRIYGNGWEHHPTLSTFAAGPAQNGRELLCVYRASRINLQLMPAGFIHQRSLDGLASGGFFLTRTTPQDLKGRLLRSLIARMDELNIDNSHDLVHGEDATLRRLFREFQGNLADFVDQERNDIHAKLRALAELDHPDETFPRFRDIAFDSADTFSRCADRFLNDEPARREYVREMRNIVVERFTYRAAMDRFLRAMACYYREAVEDRK